MSGSLLGKSTVNRRSFLAAAGAADQAENGGAGNSGTMLPLVITGSLLSIIPLVVAFLLPQRYWRSGLSTGSVKQ